MGKFKNTLTYIMGHIVPTKYSDDPEKEFFCGYTKEEFAKKTEEEYQKYRRKAEGMSQEDKENLYNRIYYNTGVDLRLQRHTNVNIGELHGKKWKEQG